MNKLTSLEPGALLHLIARLIRRHGGLRLSEQDTARLASVIAAIADAITPAPARECDGSDIAIAAAFLFGAPSTPSK